MASLDKDKSSLYTKIIQNLQCFDQYTLEVIMLYTLSTVFNCTRDSSSVRLVTLAEQLNIHANAHIKRVLTYKKIEKNKETDVKNVNTKNKDIPYYNAQFALGSLMVTFLYERELIKISDQFDFDNTILIRQLRKKMVK